MSQAVKEASHRDLSDEILTALARRSDPLHPVIRRTQDSSGLLPELIPNTGPDNGGRGYKPLTNNAFVNAAGLSQVAYVEPSTGVTLTIADIISYYSSGLIPDLEEAPGVGQELCIWSMQSLPPPPLLDASLTVPRIVDGEVQQFYNYPIEDMQRVLDLCVLAGDRLQQHMRDSNPVVMFGACSYGSEAAKALCELDIANPDGGSNCDNARVNNAIAWPQAITMFKITNETLDTFKEFIVNWRDSPDQHRPNIVWASAPYNYTEAGNDDFGGIRGSVYPGWGFQGGLRAKVVQCDKIDPMFLQPMGPNGDFSITPDAFSDETNSTTIAQLAFEEWDRLCGIPIGGANSNCTPDADLPGSVADLPPPYALLAYDESCSYTSEYIAASATCGSSLNLAFGDTSAASDFEARYFDGIAACGKAFCESLTYLPSVGTFAINDFGLLFCSADDYRNPEVCEEGELYMVSLRDYGLCTLNVTSSISEEKRLASQEAQSPSSGSSLAACETMLTCDEKTAISLTDNWATRFCVNVFQTIRNPIVFANDSFAWVEACGFSGDGSEGSPIFVRCQELGFGANTSDITVNATSASPVASPVDASTAAPVTSPPVTATPITATSAAPVSSPLVAPTAAPVTSSPPVTLTPTSVTSAAPVASPLVAPTAAPVTSPPRVTAAPASGNMSKKINMAVLVPTLIMAASLVFW